MNWLTEPFELLIYKRALLAAIIIGFTNGYVSAYVVLRKAALKTGSLSHALLPGIAFAILLFGLTPWSAFAGAVVAALIIGLGSLMVSQTSRIDQDTALAVLYTAAFSAGIVLLGYVNAPGELEHWLFGDIRGMSDNDLWTVFIIAAASLLVLTLFQRPIIVMLFEPNVARSLGIPVTVMNYVLFALVILVLISSLQAVGCILALGLLVTPAATMLLFTDSPLRLFWGGGILGTLCSVAALIISYWLDWPTGSSIVLILGTVFVIAFLISPKYGVLLMLRQRHHHHESHA
ncbi:metal ABC transporter permease [bacterium]|nr:metal ABC transporter permease [bacterium]